jgi:hypothetical protein
MINDILRVYIDPADSGADVILLELIDRNREDPVLLQVPVKNKVIIAQQVNRGNLAITQILHHIEVKLR